MIRTIDIRLNAAHPELPLPEATTYQNAPSTAFLRGVPKSCGLWQITAVSVAVTFPDNSTTTRAAVLSAGDVWVATIPACATSGRTTSGLRILADGTDENGDAVTGYVLGVADLAVATFDIAPAPGETSYALRYFDNVPNPPHKGDVATVDGTLKYYDGTAWQPFAGVPPPSTSAPLMDGTASAGTSAAYARGDHRHPTDTTRASKEDATLTERGFSEWTITAVPEGLDPADVYVDWGDPDSTYGYEAWYFAVPSGWFWTDITDQSITSLASDGFAATRTALSGYQLGSDTNHILASEAEAEALRTGKQNALSAQQLANIAAVPGKANASDMDVALSQKQDRYTAWHVEVELPAPNAEAVGQPYWDSVSSVWTQKMRYSGDGEHWTEIIVPDETGGGLDATSIAGNLAFSATRSAIIDGKANRASPATAGNLAALDANGNPTDSLIPAANVALKGEIPYSLGTPTIIDTASSETVEGETVYYGAATLADRTANIVGMVVALDELRVTIPPAVSGKVRDFGLYVAVGSGEGTALAAPALVPVAPTGETITIMNAEGEMPTLADGTTTKSGTTVLYFTEVVNGVFLVKGEQVEEVA